MSFFSALYMLRNVLIVLLHVTCIFIQKKKKKNDPYFGMGKNTKVMPQMPCYLSFLLGKGGNPYTSNPMKSYPKTESNIPIHTGGGLITSRFWLEIPLKLQHQTIQIKALVCDSECPYDLILGQTSMAQLSAC